MARTLEDIFRLQLQGMPKEVVLCLVCCVCWYVNNVSITYTVNLAVELMFAMMCEFLHLKHAVDWLSSFLNLSKQRHQERNLCLLLFLKIN
jgi:hypothetical protein